MSNRDCENFRESMNTEPSRENDNKIDYKKNTQVCAKQIFKIIPDFTYDRDPIGNDRADYNDNMNTEPIRENANKIDYKNNTKACAKHIFKKIPDFTDDRDPIGNDRVD